MVVAVSVAGVVDEQTTCPVGAMVFVKEQAKVVPEHGPALQSLVDPKTVEPPFVVMVPVALIVPPPETLVLPVDPL